MWELGNVFYLFNLISLLNPVHLRNPRKIVHPITHIVPLLFLDVKKMVSGRSSNARKTSEGRYATSDSAGSESDEIRRLPGRQRYRHGEGGLI